MYLHTKEPARLVIKKQMNGTHFREIQNARKFHLKNILRIAKKKTIL